MGKLMCSNKGVVYYRVSLADFSNLYCDIKVNLKNTFVLFGVIFTF